MISTFDRHANAQRRGRQSSANDSTGPKSWAIAKLLGGVPPGDSLLAVPALVAFCGVVAVFAVLAVLALVALALVVLVVLLARDFVI